MEKKNIAEWISIILCLLPSPMVLMYILYIVGVWKEQYAVNVIWLFAACILIGGIAFYISYVIISKIIYFIIK